MGKIKNAAYTKEQIISIASQFKTTVDLQRTNPSVYNAARRMNLLKELFPCAKRPYHIKSEEDIESLIIEKSKLCKTRSELSRRFSSVYRLASQRNMLDQLYPIHKHVFTQDELIEEAKKYKTRTEFHQKNCRAYIAARSLGILDEIGLPCVLPSDRSKLPKKRKRTSESHSRKSKIMFWQKGVLYQFLVFI